MLLKIAKLTFKGNLNKDKLSEEGLDKLGRMIRHFTLNLAWGPDRKVFENSIILIIRIGIRN